MLALIAEGGGCMESVVSSSLPRWGMIEGVGEVGPFVQRMLVED